MMATLEPLLLTCEPVYLARENYMERASQRKKKPVVTALQSAPNP